MRALLLTTDETRTAGHLRDAFQVAGFESVAHHSIKQVSLLADNRRQGLLLGEQRVEGLDAVYLSAPLRLVPYVEPLLEQLHDKGVYCQLRPGAFYIASNKPLQCAVLTRSGVQVPRTYLFGEPGRVRRVAGRFTYPVLFKTFTGQEKTQSILIESERSLRSVAKGTKASVDAVLVREFIEAPLDEVAVVGEKVFAIRRRLRDGEVEDTEKGTATKLTSAEESVARRVAGLCRCEIATVRMAGGYVLDVEPLVRFNTFNRKASEDLFEEAAALFLQRAGGGG